MIHTEHSVQSLAHQIWESEGKPVGQAERHWHLAARLIAEHKHHSHQNNESHQTSQSPQKNQSSQNKPSQKRSIDPSEKKGPIEPEQPDQT